MTIGISKEKLANINPWVFETQQDLLNFIIDSCKELDPWLPFEDVPRDRKIIAYNPFIGQYITRYTNGQWPCFGASELGGMKISNEAGASIHYPQPTHYKELSKHPKNS